MPYSYRQNPIADDECVRELIFKGFVVVFVIGYVLRLCTISTVRSVRNEAFPSSDCQISV